MSHGPIRPGIPWLRSPETCQPLDGVSGAVTLMVTPSDSLAFEAFASPWGSLKGFLLVPLQALRKRLSLPRRSGCCIRSRSGAGAGEGRVFPALVAWHCALTLKAGGRQGRGNPHPKARLKPDFWLLLLCRGRSHLSLSSAVTAARRCWAPILGLVTQQLQQGRSRGGNGSWGGT